MTSANSTGYDKWAHGLTTDGVRRQFRDLGCDLVIVKVLGRNNNSKQQVWLANHLNDLSALPFATPRARPGTSGKKSKSGAIFHCDLEFSWLGPQGLAAAPNAKLVYHPQYPEVRLSGFLRGCPAAPSHLMRIEERGAEAGRVLLLGMSHDKGAVYGLVVGADAPLATAVLEMRLERWGVLLAWPLVGPVEENPRGLLLAELCGVARRGWVPGQRLTSDGVLPYRAPNGGGYTLESLLGVVSNAHAAPDCHGHEVKQFGVGRLDRPRSKEVSLFDTVPDGGEYRRLGVADFIQKYGHHNPGLRRFDFAGRHRVGHPPPRTGAQLQVEGYDGEHMDAEGSLAIVATSGDILMQWSFAKLMDHWGRKHAFAAYIPSETRDITTHEGSVREYRYGQVVQLGAGTDFTLFLDAVRSGTIKFDPGMHAPAITGEQTTKVRSLFRISSRDLSSLYDSFESVDACVPTSSADIECLPASAL